MDKLRNSFAFGIVLGLALSLVLLIILDAVVYFVHVNNGQRILEVDVTFAICIMVSMLLARKFFRKDGQQELGKGFLFASFIWGAAYVYLFHVRHIRILFFIS